MWRGATRLPIYIYLVFWTFLTFIVHLCAFFVYYVCIEVNAESSEIVDIICIVSPPSS